MVLRKNWVRYLLGLIILGIFLQHVLDRSTLPLLHHQENFFYDSRVKMFSPGDIDDRIVIVDIDEASLSSVGRWPWNRSVMSDLVTRLFEEQKVAVLGFDIVFSEKDESSGLSSLEKLARDKLKDNPEFINHLDHLRGELNYDKQFEATLAKYPVVMGYYLRTHKDETGSIGALPPPVFESGHLKVLDINLPHFDGFGGNLPEFQAAAKAGGHFTPMVDSDGIIRKSSMLFEFNGAAYEALSLAMIRVLLKETEIEPVLAEGGAGYRDLEGLRLRSPRGDFLIPVDGQAAALIPYRGPQGSFPYVSAADILSGKLPPATLEGKIILVGATAPGLNDLRATPVGGIYAGVEAHANLIAGIIDENIQHRPEFATGLEFMVSLVSGLVLIFFLPRLSPLKATLLCLPMVAFIIGGAYWLWMQRMVVAVAAPVWTVLSLYLLNMCYGFFVESRTKRQFADLFGQYVPPELVDEMSKNPESYSMEGRSAELTILFSDVRDFTSISEGLEARDLAALMNEYLGLMTETIREQRGTLDKYIGDAIMAFWGAPVNDADHARHAVLAALEMQQKIRKLDDPFSVRGWPALHIGVGINTGTVTVGDMGSPVRKAYTVMGDAVNLASRLEGLTKYYGVGILVGEETAKLLPDILFREVDKVRVKGKEVAVILYEPMGKQDQVSTEVLEELDTWHMALSHYRRQEWSAAINTTEQLIAAHPDKKIYPLWLNRMSEAVVSELPPDWDGVTNYQTK